MFSKSYRYFIVRYDSNLNLKYFNLINLTNKNYFFIFT